MYSASNRSAVDFERAAVKIQDVIIRKSAKPLWGFRKHGHNVSGHSVSGAAVDAQDAGVWLQVCNQESEFLCTNMCREGWRALSSCPMCQGGNSLETG